MSEACDHDCNSCKSKCADDTSQQSFLVEPNKHSHIKHVVAVVSGKGGVGKSLVTSLLAVWMQRSGYHVGILDADITGPSIPKTFGVKGEVRVTEEGGYPIKSSTGIDVMSVNLLLEHDTDPVVWRGPVIANTVKQFWQDIIWENEDYLFIDMPPGTGDVPLTVFQSIPIDGIIIVTSPQELVSMIVEKAEKMAGYMKIPVLGVVENMSYFKCPDCGKEHKIYGDSHIDEVAGKYGIPVIARIPIEPQIAAACDAGKVESVQGDWFDTAAAMVKRLDKE